MAHPLRLFSYPQCIIYRGSSSLQWKIVPQFDDSLWWRHPTIWRSWLNYFASLNVSVWCPYLSSARKKLHKHIVPSCRCKTCIGEGQNTLVLTVLMVPIDWCNVRNDEGRCGVVASDATFPLASHDIQLTVIISRSVQPEERVTERKYRLSGCYSFWCPWHYLSYATWTIIIIIFIIVVDFFGGLAYDFNVGTSYCILFICILLRYLNVNIKT